MIPSPATPLLTVVTICFRNPDDLRVTLDSVAAVAGDLIESVVIDGSPDEACVDIAQSYPLARLLHGPDTGKYDAMNKGIAAARGEAILFMNSGDTFADPAAFLALVARQAAALSSTLVYGDCIRTVGGDRIAVPAPPIRAETLRVGLLPSHQSVLAPTAYYRRHPFDAALHFAADTLSLKHAFATLPHHHVAQPIANFAAGGISASPGTIRQLLRQYRELRRVHELTMRERAALTLLLVRRKIVHAAIGERGLQRIQARRLRRSVDAARRDA